MAMRLRNIFLIGFSLGFAELTYGSADASGQCWYLLGAEQEEDDGEGKPDDPFDTYDQESHLRVPDIPIHPFPFK